MWTVNDPDAGTPRYEKFGGVNVFRPGWTATIALRNESEAHFRARVKPGRYKGRDQVNEILQRDFAFYAAKLDRIIPRIASRDYLEFVLFQYDQSAEVDEISKADRLSEQEAAQWVRTGPALRRALKYLAERVVLLSPAFNPPSRDPQTLLLYAEQALICAEQLTQLYMQSDKVFSLFPDTTTIDVLPEGELDLFRCRSENDFTDDLVARARRDMMQRSKFLPALVPQMTAEGQDRFLGDAFQETIGISLRDALGVIRVVVDRAEAPPTGFKVPFCSRDMMVRQVAAHSGFPSAAVGKALAGFTVTRRGMASEGREIFKPKQEYRAYRRGFLEMPHPMGPHLAWSRKMAIENACLLVTDIPQKQIPTEWNGPTVALALGRLSNEVGKWFEARVAENFERLGIVGVASARDAIGRGSAVLPIPQNVGEIDFVGYSACDKAVVVAECKFVRGGTEPKYYRDDIKEFVTEANAFMKRLDRKAKWVCENLPAVRKALSAVTVTAVGQEVQRVMSVMVTYYPTSAAFFWKDAPCVSLTELMLDYQYSGKWPYKTGVLQA